MIFHGTLPPSPLKAITRFFLVLLTSLLTGCTLDSVIQALTKEDFKLLTYPDTNYVDVNSSTLNLEGHCDVAEGTVTLKLGSVEKEKLTCPETGLWQYQLDVASLGDGEVNLTVEQVELADATKNIKSATVTLNKDTTPPQLLAMPDIILNDKGYISWDCQNLNDKCTFRSFVSATDLFTFAAEPYTSLKSNVTFPDGKSYLFLQAKDAAGNLSAVKKIEVYSGAMGILINPMQMKLAVAQAVTLRFYIPQVFAEYTLFNNDSCTGADNWQARTPATHNWNLASAAPGAYNVSARFRTAGGIISQCFTDSIPIIDTSTILNICTAGSSTAIFGVVGSTLIGQVPGYANNENCTFTVNTTQPMDILLAAVVDTEADKDIVTVRQNGQTLYSASGSIVTAGLDAMASTQAGPFTFNFTSDAANTGGGFAMYWMPKNSIRQEIRINNGATKTSSKNLQVSFNVPAYMREYNLTEDSTCATVGTWKTIAPTQTFTATGNGPTLSLGARFRDAFGNESECTTANIQYVAPAITIVTPATVGDISNSVDLTGACSDAGATIRISGSYTGETTCSAQNLWSKSFALGTVPNNTTLNITAELMLAGTAEASASKSYTIQRFVTPSFPVANGYVGPTFTMTGTCSPNGSVINITAPNATSVSCTNGQWQSVQTVTGNNDDTVNIAGNLTFNSVVQDSFAFTTTLSTQPPLATVFGAPTGKSPEANHALTVSGIGVTAYKYKFGKDATCSNASGYSAEISSAIGIFVNQNSNADGDDMVLCVVGLNGLNGLWQDYSAATTRTWKKASLKYASLSAASKKFTEGQTAVTVGVTLDTVSAVPVRVYYNLSGDAIYMIDHNLALGYIEVPAGQLSAQITFDTLTNAMDTNDKDLDVYITHTNQPDYIAGTNARQRFIIKNTTSSYKKILSIAHGSDYTQPSFLAVADDGKLRVWGVATATTAGVTITQPALNFKQVTGTRMNFCALTDTNQVYCGGVGGLSGTGVDSGVTYKSIDLKYYTACGITSDDRVRCWDVSGSPITPYYIDDGVTKFKKVVAAQSSTICAISLADDLYCYGNNTYKQIANNATATYNVLTQVDPGVKYRDVTSYTYVCGITRDDQQIKCWGRNDFYQLGNGTSVNNPTPTVVDGATKYLQISGSNTHVCAITETNALKCWGSLIRGGYTSIQDGITYSTPTLLNTNIAWKTIQTNDGSICGIADDDMPYCFGDGTNYGDVPKTANPTLEAVDVYSSYQDMATAYGTVCAIRNDGGAYCSNTIHPLKRAHPSVDFSSAKVMSDKGVICLGLSDSSYCTGVNTNSLLGDTNSTNPKVDLVHTGGLAIQAMATADNYCINAINTAGNLYRWGSTSASGCPPGTTTTPTLVPTSVKFKPIIRSVATAGCALSLDNEVYCWGAGSIMRTGISTTPINVDPGYRYTDIQLSTARFCGILENGQVRCWGSGSLGKLGHNSTADSTGTLINGGRIYTQLALGNSAACGITGTTLECWGNGYSNVPVAVNGGASYQQVVMGNGEMIALTTSGAVHFWRISDYMSPPTVISGGVSFAKLSATNYSGTTNSMFCALTTTNKLYCRTPWGAGTSLNMLHQVRAARF
ncbi:RCC1 domain-containing protein [Bdellovibrio bacteriovorus]|uniref:RCC1 domain-containing protein n=1 Tax=Bdellovibrio bacteriovorus TaxID=959 RepID=UPI003D089121